MTKKFFLYIIIVLLSLLGTALFMCYHHALFAPYGMDDRMLVLWHSLPHHLTVAGYVMALPLLAELLRIWLPGRWHSWFMTVYMCIITVPLLLGWFANLVLYGFWGICLDSTALIYLQDNPRDALAETPLWAIVVLLVLLVATVWGVKQGMKLLYPTRKKSSSARLTSIGFGHRQRAMRRQMHLTLACLVLCGVDFLAIRGGWTPATQNPGRAYFSSQMPLNHAAVNPVFNFLYSLGKRSNFDQQYRFMSDAEADAALAELCEQATTPSADGQRLQLIDPEARPDILLILFESFSGAACKALHSEAQADWMPNVSRMYSEALGFTRFYANSFRTDRGVASVLASYPGQPTNSVMKDQSKCDNLQYLSKRLGEAGYDLQFVHGGDVNFTNMQGFLRAGGITNIVGDADFPLSQRLSKWGVPDHLMFEYMLEQIKASANETDEASLDSSKGRAPFFKVFLTLSSHEPFDVPYHHFDDPYLNSVAYTDSCFGAFIDKLQADSLLWSNLLVIGMPDHCYAQYPQGIQQHDPLRYHIPMFWTGGALLLPTDTLGIEQHTIDVLGQQTDLSATLLAQLGIRHEDFNFSKDLLDPSAPHFAFYSFSDGFGLLTDSCSFVQDNKQPGTGLQPGTHDPQGQAQRWGKAYLQRLYDDLARR